jgi:hypothetical protein
MWGVAMKPIHPQNVQNENGLKICGIYFHCI